MSEYQYYEFQAIDRPLDEADRQALQALSSRARVTATSFTNHYNYGDFRGDPYELMERWFDLHLHLSNWGTRRLMMRVPRRFLDTSRLDAFVRKVEWVRVRESGESWIVDIHYRTEDPGYSGWEEGEGWLAALAPLRADVLAGDSRLFYLLWLTAAQAGDLNDDEKEPLPGIGPLTSALDTFADFFHIDPDLVRASAERSADGDGEPIPADASTGQSQPFRRRRRRRCFSASSMATLVWRRRSGAGFGRPSHRRPLAGRLRICAPAPRRFARSARSRQPNDGKPSGASGQKRRRRGGGCGSVPSQHGGWRVSGVRSKRRSKDAMPPAMGGRWTCSATFGCWRRRTGR